MSAVKQVGLLAAGCQPWNADVAAASGDRFAYCATLAIYIYELDRKYNEFKLLSIMSEHKKTITALAWNPHDVDIFASSSSDNIVVVWNVAEHKAVAKLVNTALRPKCLGWCRHDDTIAFIQAKGPLYIWNPQTGHGPVPHKDAQSFSSDVCLFRMHPKKIGKIAFGHSDGSLSILNPGQKIQKHVLRPEDSEGSDDEDGSTALEWDPLSVEYLLVANKQTGVRLLDTEAMTVIMTFQLPSAAAQVHTIAWIGGAPGMFLTGDYLSGVMRLWTVSKNTPIENIRLKKTGFHALCVFSTANADQALSGQQSPSHSSSTSLAAGPVISPTSKFTLPPAHALCTFLDGGVGLYDLGRRKWNFLRDLGHIETIFDCRFKPDDPNLLATGSFDGTIKIWDVNTMKAVDSSPGNEGVIYALSWAPGDLNCIVACTSRQGAFIWNITKGKIIRRFQEHGKYSVYSVAWNQKDSKLIATCGADGFCVIRQVDGKLVLKYKHPGPVYGCDWSTHNKDMIATGCEDKNVRIFYLATTNEHPLKVFSGHSAKVFHVRWSPLREGILCSGSDDCTVRVWDYTQEKCVMVLKGHSGPVRGLLWSWEIPYLLITGSWDYAIRIWDTRDGACLDTVLDHGADVYGLTCHPERPFVLASSSRDSTVRIWSLTPLVQPIEINILAGKPWDDIMTNPEYAMADLAPPLLTGRTSREIKSQLEKVQQNKEAAKQKSFSQMFIHPSGSNNLWELVSVICGADEIELSPNYNSGIMHLKHMSKYKNAAAQQLEMVKMSKFGAGIGAPNKEQRLREAANIYIRMGNVQRYCELMIELGEWEKALSVAPGVSMSYWQSLSERRAKYLMSDDSDDAIAFCVVTGKVDMLVSFLLSRGSLLEALHTAAAAYDGNIPASCSHPAQSQVNGVAADEEDSMALVRQTSDELANWYFRNGSPMMGACCYLAVDDCQKGLSMLIRGNELELTISVGRVLNNCEALVATATEYLARRCERLGKWELAVDLLKTVPDSSVALAKVCSRCAASMDEINNLHSNAGFPPMDECVSVAEEHKNTDIFEAVQYYLLSTSPDEGLIVGLREVKKLMSLPDWTVNDVSDLMDIMASMQTEKLHKCESYRRELLILSSYIGGLLAIRRQYDCIVPALFQHATHLMKDTTFDLPISRSLISSELEAWQANLRPSSNKPKPIRQNSSRSLSVNGDQMETFYRLVRKTGQETSKVEPGPDLVSGSHLPSHSDVHQSYFTGRRIQGAAFFLEDGKSSISVNEALMWAKVNPFSPLGSGVRINPF